MSTRKRDRSVGNGITRSERKKRSKNSLKENVVKWESILETTFSDGHVLETSCLIISLPVSSYKQVSHTAVFCLFKEIFPHLCLRYDTHCLVNDSWMSECCLYMSPDCVNCGFQYRIGVHLENWWIYLT